MATSIAHLTRPQLLGVCLLAVLGLPINASAAAQVEDIGSLPGRHSLGRAASIDGRTLVGITSVGVSGGDAFIWTEGGGFRLLDSGTASRSHAFDVSDDGRVAVGTWNDTDVVVWDTLAGTTVQLGPPPGFPFFVGPKVSGDGSTVVSNSGTPTGGGIVIWVPGSGFTSIGSLGSSSLTYQGMSRDGTTIVGNAFDPSGVEEGFIWTAAAGIVSLSAPGVSASVAKDISADGRFVAGIERTSSGNSNIVLWRDGIPFVRFPANTFPAGYSPMYLSADGSTMFAQDPIDFSGNGGETFVWSLSTGKVVLDPMRELTPRAISFDGSVVTCSERASLAETVGLRWTATGGFEELEGLGPQFTAPAFISGDGSIILGESIRPDNRTHAVVWRSSGVIGTGYCGPAVPNSSGAPARMSLGGINTLDHGELILRATQLPPGSFGFFLVSPQPGLVTTILGSQGTLCLGGPIGRYVGPGQILSASPAGDMSLSIDPRMMASPTGSVTPTFGQSFYFQAWFRDANPASTSNLTDASMVPIY